MKRTKSRSEEINATEEKRGSSHHYHVATGPENVLID